jgi:hypothetical protein
LSTLSLSGFSQTLESLAGNFASFFNGLASPLSTIANIPQAIAGGLVTLAGAIWDALIKAFQALANGIYSGLQWLYNGAVYVIDCLITVMHDLYNFFVGLFNDIWSAVNSIFSTIGNAANTFFSAQVTAFRSKIKAIIVADLAIGAGYPAIRDLPQELSKAVASARSLDDGFTGVFKAFGTALAAPFLAAIGGAVFGELIDALIGPTSARVSIMPTIQVPPLTIQQFPTHPVAPPSPPGSPLPYPTTNQVRTRLNAVLGLNLVRVVTGPKPGVSGAISVVITGPSIMSKPMGGSLSVSSIVPSGDVHVSLGG